MQQKTPARVGAAFMPKRKARAAPGGGSGLTAIKSVSVEKKEAGWEFMKFVTSTPNTVDFSQQTGYMVVRTDAEKNPEFQAYLRENPNAKVTFDQAQYIRTGDSIAEAPRAAQAGGRLRVVGWPARHGDADLEALLAWGVDGITSDYPTRALAALRARGISPADDWA